MLGGPSAALPAVEGGGDGGAPKVAPSPIVRRWTVPRAIDSSDPCPVAWLGCVAAQGWRSPHRCAASTSHAACVWPEERRERAVRANQLARDAG